MKKSDVIWSRELSLKGIENEEMKAFHLGSKAFDIGWCLDGAVVSRDPLTGKAFRLGGPFLFSFLKERYELAHQESGALERFGEKFQGAELRKLIEIYVGMIKTTLPKVYKKDTQRLFFEVVEYDDKKPYTGE
jgi:hypothetical protein